MKDKNKIPCFSCIYSIIFSCPTAKKWYSKEWQKYSVFFYWSNVEIRNEAIKHYYSWTGLVCHHSRKRKKISYHWFTQINVYFRPISIFTWAESNHEFKHRLIYPFSMRSAHEETDVWIGLTHQFYETPCRPTLSCALILTTQTFYAL